MRHLEKANEAIKAFDEAGVKGYSLAVEEKTGINSIMYHGEVFTRIYENPMKVAEAKKLFDAGLIDEIEIIQVAEDEYKVELNLKDQKIPIEKFRGGVRLFQSADAAIATSRSIGIREVKVIML